METKIVLKEILKLTSFLKNFLPMKGVNMKMVQRMEEVIKVDKVFYSLMVRKLMLKM